MRYATINFSFLPPYLALFWGLALIACEKEIPEAAKSTADPSELAQPAMGAKKEPPSAGIAWEAELYFRTYSSPRLFTTPNGPMVLIAFGDENPAAGGAFALDAITGARQWKISTKRELFALPTPLTPRADGTQGWVFAGRDGQLHAVDGATGEALWHFSPSGETGRSAGVYNFYSGRELGDANGDGIGDYLVTNGGDSQLGPSQIRPPGHLMVISGTDGGPIHRLQVPDGRETYCSPLLWSRLGEEWVVFGTGGETFPGSLWAIPADSVRAGTLAGIRTLVDNKEGKGFIAPPSFADLDSDGVLDLIATPFEGRLTVLSGATLEPLWSFAAADTEETQASPALGDFDGDGDLDIAAIVHRGVFPRWQGAAVRAFEGQTGALLWEHQIEENMLPPSPLAADMDADGRDEIFLVESDPGYFVGKASRSKLQIAHIEADSLETLATVDGLSPSSGWVGDAEGDGWLEWFVPLSKIGRGSLLRFNLGQPVPAHIAWGGYLGTRHDGVY